jgi:hypothetical protein
MSRSRAVEYALYDSGIREPVEVRAYYVSPMATFSVLEEPYYMRHRDLILDDIRASGWARERADIVTGERNVSYSHENKTTKQFLTEVAGREHKFGLWAVAVLTETREKGNAPYISKGRGEYYYFDGLTGKLIMKTEH